MDQRTRRDSTRAWSLLDLHLEAVEQALGGPLPPTAAAAFRAAFGAAIDLGRELERANTMAARAERDECRARNAASQRLARAKTAEVARLRRELGRGDTQPIAVGEE
jgi:hypothetical protein